MTAHKFWIKGEPPKDGRMYLALWQGEWNTPVIRIVRWKRWGGWYVYGKLDIIEVRVGEIVGYAKIPEVDCETWEALGVCTDYDELLIEGCSEIAACEEGDEGKNG